MVEFLEGCAKGMLQDILDTVKGIDSDIKVTINFAALYNKEIQDMLDYQFTEPWAGNWLSAAYARDTAPGQYPQLGPGDVSEVYNYQPESRYILAAAQIAAQGCRVFIYSGSQHPDGTLEHEEAKRVGAAYREIQKFEQYLSQRKVVADIGIIQSDTASNVPIPVVRLEISCLEIVGYVCYDRPGQKELIVHEVSHMAELAKGDMPLIPGGELRILDGWKNIKSAELVYSGQEVLKIEEKEGWLSIKLPSLAIHQIIRLRYD